MALSVYFNPYSNVDFGGFFVELGRRLGLLMQGKLPWTSIAADEVQLLVLMLVAASSALVGCFLVLRKITMLANSLSHTILLGIVLAYVLLREGILGSGGQHLGIMNSQVLLFSAFLMGLITVFLTEFLTKKAKLQEDASTGLVFTSLFAISIILVTLLTRNAHIGAEVVMGNVDSLQADDIRFVSIIFLINAVVIILLFKEFTICTFDPGLARALGISPLLFNYLLMTLVSITVIGAFRAVGVLMVLSFITGPPLAARLLTNSFKKMLMLSVFLGCLASLIGVAISRHLLTVYDVALSTSGIVVCTIVAIYVAIIAVTKIKNYVAKPSLKSVA